MSTSVPDPEGFVTGSLTDIGQLRSVNQDYCDEFSDPATGRRMWMLADGMGGHRGGEIASRMAVEAAAEVFARGGSDTRTLLRRAFETANQQVHQAALEDMELAGMGTTGVCLLFETGGRAWVAHVGDSRAYRMRRNKLEQTRLSPIRVRPETNTFLRRGRVRRSTAQPVQSRSPVCQGPAEQSHCQAPMGWH